MRLTDPEGVIVPFDPAEAFITNVLKINEPLVSGMSAELDAISVLLPAWSIIRSLNVARPAEFVSRGLVPVIVPVPIRFIEIDTFCVLLLLP